MAKPAFADYIIHEDADYLAVNKPPYVSSLQERLGGKRVPNLLAMAREYNENLQLCHRLDKETSGVLLMAKNPEAYRWAAMQFEARNVGKIYHAIACGVHRFDQTEINLPIAKAGNALAVIDRETGKPATTYFNTLKVYRGYTLVECIPVTGRMHQIRVHLMCLKAPIVQDEVYGGKPIYLSKIKRDFKLKGQEDEQPLISRVALHAKQLIMPVGEDAMLELEAPYPKDIKALINQLDRYAS